MRLIIGNDEVTIPEDLYKTAGNMANLILNSLKTKTDVTSQRLLFYALITALNVKTSELLHCIDEEDLRMLVTSWHTQALKQKETHSE